MVGCSVWSLWRAGVFFCGLEVLLGGLRITGVYHNFFMLIFVSKGILFYFWSSKFWIWILIGIWIHQSLDPDSMNIDPQHRVRLSNLPLVSRRRWKKAVLRIHDILVWIRIRIWIRGSMPLTYGSGFGSGSFYFHHWSSRCQQKTNLKKSFPAYYFLKVLLHQFSKIKSKKSHKTVDIKVFLTILA